MAVSGGNDCTWRVEWPAEAVGGKAVLIEKDEAVETFSSPNRDSGFPWQIVVKQGGKAHRLDTAAAWYTFCDDSPTYDGMWTEFPAHEGVAVFTRPDWLRATLAKAMRMNGIHTVAESDDNYFCDASLNLFQRHLGADENTHMAHARAMVQMDANIFSTAWLRDRYYKAYRERFGKKGLPPMFVCRNHIPRDAWPTVEDYDGPLRVGFMGSPSHVWDISALAYTTFHAAKQLGCKTTMIGYSPANPDPDIPDEIRDALRSERSREVQEKWATVVDESIPWIDPERYHRQGLPLDIGLCPLLWNDFTAGKSDIKPIEMVVNGAVPVVSAHPVYLTAGWKHEVNCLVGGSPEELALAVVRLVKDAKLREDLLAAGHEMVANERNEQVMRDEWMVALAG